MNNDKWTQVGGRFINGTVSVSIGVAYELIVSKTKEQAMKALEVGEQSYYDFSRLVRTSLSIGPKPR